MAAASAALEAASAPLRARLDEIQSTLGTLEADLATAKKNHDEQAEPLKTERAGLRKAIESLEKALGGTSSAPASSNGHKVDDSEGVSYESIIANITENGRNPRKTPQIASDMGVGPRQIARKLKKLADEEKIAGTKDTGYFALAA